jgi:alkaline phosphatase D
MLNSHPTRRQVIAASLAALLAPSMGAEPSPDPKPKAKPKPKKGKPNIPLEPDAITGPMVGHTSDTETHLWIRPAKAGTVTAIVASASGGAEKRLTAQADAEHDFCVSIRVPDLRPATAYAYRFEQDGKALGEGRFRTWAANDQPSKVTLALGSCALTESSPVWTRMRQSGCEAILLMGDTPYIDNYKLETVRRHQREFLHIPELKPLLAQMPVWGTWDDHDFGLNSHHGNSDLKGKQATRKAFVEYRALANHGEKDEGIYTSFRAGPIEVLLLDPRWFSMTEKSPVDSEKPSCFGAMQWDWIKRTLKASTAPFKLLAMGEIWQDKENKETDDMGTFPYEREALFDFLHAEKISGVFLFGGDIHCSRHLCTKGRAGYDVHEFVSSPIHEGIIPSLNVPLPDLVWGEPIPQTFLRVVADSTVTPAKLTATFLQADDRTLHEVKLTAADLTAA